MTVESESLAKKVRISILQMCSQSRSSHVASSLSVADILAVLYSGAANVHGGGPNSPDRDVVLLSKGHAAAALYATLAHQGFFPVEWLSRYASNGAELGGHVTAGRIPGVELSTGSLGHALPVGAGIAYAQRLRSLASRVFVVTSDGEWGEGSNWEAALFAGHHGLRNLTVVIDRNRLQSLDSTEVTLRLEPLDDKLTSFGWRVVTTSGHDHDGLFRELSESERDPRAEGPLAIICETVKGKGVSFMENSVEWHYRPPDENQLDEALREVGS